MSMLAGCVLASGGCGPSLESQIQGHWALDKVSLTAPPADSTEKIVPEKQFATDLLMEGLGMDLQTEFRRDGTLSFSASALGVTKEKTGRWQVAERGQQQLTLRVTWDENQRQEDLTITIVDKDHLIMRPPGPQGEPLPFHRIPTPAP